MTLTQLTAPALEISVLLDVSCVTRAVCSEITLSVRQGDQRDAARIQHS